MGMVCFEEEKLPKDRKRDIIKNSINENNKVNNAHSHSPKNKENNKSIKKENKDLESHNKEKKMNIKDIFNEVYNKHNKIRKLYKNQELY